MEKAIIETPAGFAGLCWSGSGLVLLNLPAPTVSDAEIELESALERLPGRPNEAARPPAGGSIDVKRLEKGLNDYFSGKRADLSVPVDWSHYTEFQKKVLQRVYSVPWGRVVSYGQIAREVGTPRGARAVGGAVGSNRVLLVVPCHRVIAHDGTLGGFGGGLDWKRKLLKIEGLDI
ncbi:MAG: methylated-DNA--[protein]-cysteine S-methyltransferase [Peptococcaceae bacterium]|nr:methylated-DNA--[protein]-cysteine S-methyltransferase [Peptococcaceae bacterium]